MAGERPGPNGRWVSLTPNEAGDWAALHTRCTCSSCRERVFPGEGDTGSFPDGADPKEWLCEKCFHERFEVLRSDGGGRRVARRRDGGHGGGD
jgi:hypothetical protein